MRQPVRNHSIIADSARWEGLSLWNGDMIISSPSKCGTTWTQMICACRVEAWASLAVGANHAPFGWKSWRLGQQIDGDWLFL